MCVEEGGQTGRGNLMGEAHGHLHTQVAGDLSPGILHLLLEVADLGQDHADPFEVARPFFGRPDAPRGPAQELYAEMCLKVLDRGAGDAAQYPEFMARPRETAELRRRAGKG